MSNVPRLGNGFFPSEDMNTGFVPVNSGIHPVSVAGTGGQLSLGAGVPSAISRVCFQDGHVIKKPAELLPLIPATNRPTEETLLMFVCGWTWLPVHATPPPTRCIPDV